MSEHEEQAERFLDAMILGAIADEAFKEACEDIGLDPAKHYDSPLLAIATARATKGTRQ